MNSQNRIQFLLQYDSINRASYCTHAMFEIEHFLKLIARMIEMKKINQYGQFTEEFLKLIDKYDKNTFLVLTSPAHVRNSLHNNGYSSYDFQLLVGDISYEFLAGQQVTQTGWDDMYSMFDKLVDKLIEIIESQKVQSLQQIPHTSMSFMQQE